MSQMLPEDDEVETPTWQNPAFLLAAVPTVIAVLSMFGYVPHADVETVNGLVTNLVQNGFLFGTSALALYRYFKKDESVTLQKMAMRQELRIERLRQALREK